ncbi:uncharacterized protein LOC103787380 [Callithrix jacchus]
MLSATAGPEPLCAASLDAATLPLVLPRRRPWPGRLTPTALQLAEAAWREGLRGCTCKPPEAEEGRPFPGAFGGSRGQTLLWNLRREQDPNTSWFQTSDATYYYG